MKKTATSKTEKQVIILATYKWKTLDRVCYTVRASNGTDTYNCCFDNGRPSCTCPARPGTCYHIKQLRPCAEEWRQSHKAEQAAPAATLDAEELATVIDEDTLRMPVVSPEHKAATERVIERLVGAAKPVATKKSADLAPLNGNRPAPVGASTTYQAPRQLASIPMR